MMFIMILLDVIFIIMKVIIITADYLCLVAINLPM